MITINNYEEFESYLGNEMGISDWHKIDQSQINVLADANLYHQCINIDTERTAT